MKDKRNLCLKILFFGLLLTFIFGSVYLSQSKPLAFANDGAVPGQKYPNERLEKSVYVSGPDSTYNCYAFAIGINLGGAPIGFYSRQYIDTSDPALLAQVVKDDLIVLGIDPESIVISNTRPDNPATGEHLICLRTGNGGWHFMRYYNGSWYHKQGFNEIQRFLYEPDEEIWTDESLFDDSTYPRCTYDSEIYYIKYTLPYDELRDAFLMYDKLILRFEFNDDKKNRSNRDYYYFTSLGEPYELPIPTREGYTFDGWYYNSTQIPISGIWDIENYNYKPQNIEEHIYGITNNNNVIYLQAKWTPNQYNVTFDWGGGCFIETVTYNSHYEIPDPPEFPGYTFAGWYNNSDFIGEPVPQGVYWMITPSDITYYAKWIASSKVYSTLSKAEISRQIIFKNPLLPVLSLSQFDDAYYGVKCVALLSIENGTPVYYYEGYIFNFNTALPEFFIALYDINYFNIWYDQYNGMIYTEINGIPLSRPGLITFDFASITSSYVFLTPLEFMLYFDMPLVASEDGVAEYYLIFPYYMAPYLPGPVLPELYAYDFTINSSMPYVILALWSNYL